MKRSLWTLAGLALALLLAAAAPEPAPRIIAVRAGRLIDGQGGPPVRDAVILIQGDRITAAGPGVARRAGAEVIDLSKKPDRLEETIAGFRRARDRGADVLVTTGGASVGDYDLVQPALAAEGLALSFWKVAVRPGKPLLSGRLGAMRVLGLPGNPVSAYVCAVLFLTPLIRKLLGRSDLDLALARGVLGRDVKTNDERADYLRATLALRTDGTPVATPFPVQDSSMLVPLAGADCLVVRAPHEPAAAAGSPCVFVTLQD